MAMVTYIFEWLSKIEQLLDAAAHDGVAPDVNFFCVVGVALQRRINTLNSHNAIARLV